MLATSFVDIYSNLVLLVAYGIYVQRAEHHTATAHEIVHALIHSGLKVVRVDAVKVDQSVSCNLDLVAVDMVDETPDVQLMNLSPNYEAFLVVRPVVATDENDFLR